MLAHTSFRLITGLSVALTPGLLLWTSGLAAQTIEPVIVEYNEKADGKFEVVNDTLVPMAIVIEPKSFSIAADGRGVYRPLDSGIHVKLSTTSFRLEPKQTSYVFYKASADRLPAWFTAYASFSPIQPHEGMNVRVMLPHTVYLYQKKPVSKESIHVGPVSYRAQDESVICDVENTGPSLVRVQEVRALAGKKSVVTAGFPLLPGSSRHLSINWKEKGQPEYLLLQFPHFEVKEPLDISDRRRDQATGQATGHGTGHGTGQSTDQLTDQSRDQPARQAANNPTGQPKRPDSSNHQDGLNLKGP